MADQNFQLPVNQQGEVLPNELDSTYFNNLDQIMQRQEKQQMDRVQGTLENQGFLRSGQNFKDVSEQVLGPSIERRNNALLPMAQDAAMRGREERLGTLNFQRQEEFAAKQQQYKLEQMDKQAQISRMLMQLQDDMNHSGGFGFGDFLGQAVGMGVGAMFGGVGAGIGGAVGKRIGGSFDRSSGGSSGAYGQRDRY